MVVQGYNITLKRITSADIEMIRQWRNAAHVSAYMENREPISPQQQQQWFSSIDNVSNNYFLIIDEAMPAGIIYSASVDWDKGINGNGGIFMGDEKYFATLVPLRAAFLAIEAGIYLGLHTNYSNVLKENKRAIFFNKKLGYQLLPGQQNVHNQQYVMYTHDYLRLTAPLKKALGHENEKILVTLEDDTHPVNVNFIRQYHKILLQGHPNFTFQVKP